MAICGVSDPPAVSRRPQGKRLSSAEAEGALPRLLGVSALSHLLYLVLQPDLWISDLMIPYFKSRFFKTNLSEYTRRLSVGSLSLERSDSLTHHPSGNCPHLGTHCHTGSSPSPAASLPHSSFTSPPPQVNLPKDKATTNPANTPKVTFVHNSRTRQASGSA